MPVTSWDVLDDVSLGDYKIFELHQRRMRSPATEREFDFYVLDVPNWVNIIPITPDGDVVCVRQFRAGTEAVTLEVPGGMIDPEDDDPVAAGLREMREETGYTADRCVNLGAVAPNPAIQSNRCYSIAALDAVPDGPPQLEGAEEIEITHVPLGAIPGLILDGTITHSLVVAAFYLLDAHRRAGTLGDEFAGEEA